jgi:hypothetical protein
MEGSNHLKTVLIICGDFMLVNNIKTNIELIRSSFEIDSVIDCKSALENIKKN